MASPYLLLGFFVAGLIHVWVSPSKIVKYLGGKNWKSVLLASCVGVPLPLCSCSVLPTAAALREKGASKGATASFLISTPETGVDSIALTYSLMDLPMTILRPIAAFLTAFIAGIAVNLFGVSRKETMGNEIIYDDVSSLSCGYGSSGVPQEAVSSSCRSSAPTTQTQGETGCCSSPEESSGSGKAKEVPTFWLREALQYAFGKLSDDLSYWLTIGFVLSGLLSALIPADLFDTWVGQGIPSLFLMLAVSVPVYMCASGSTPIAAVLIAKGLSPGAALVFLLAGPATNIGSFPVLSKILGKKELGIYLFSIAIVSLMFGFAVNTLYAYWNVLPRMSVESACMEDGHIIGQVAAIIMVVLLCKGMWKRPVPDEWKQIGRGMLSFRKR